MLRTLLVRAPVTTVVARTQRAVLQVLLGAVAHGALVMLLAAPVDTAARWTLLEATVWSTFLLTVALRVWGGSTAHSVSAFPGWRYTRMLCESNPG